MSSQYRNRTYVMERIMYCVYQSIVLFGYFKTPEIPTMQFTYREQLAYSSGNRRPQGLCQINFL